MLALLTWSRDEYDDLAEALSDRLGPASWPTPLAGPAKSVFTHMVQSHMDLDSLSLKSIPQSPAAVASADAAVAALVPRLGVDEPMKIIIEAMAGLGSEINQVSFPITSSQSSIQINITNSVKHLQPHLPISF